MNDDEPRDRYQLPRLEFPTGDQTWRERAECRGVGPGLFFPDVGESNVYGPAKEHFCDHCQVRRECGEAGVMEQHGMWAGTTPSDREKYRGANGLKFLPPIIHGTARGYEMERGRGLETCGACKEAYSQYRRARMERAAERRTDEPAA